MPERRISASLRRQVYRRANGCCEYCRSQERFAPDTFSVEHTVAHVRGGETAAHNLALACQGCNNHKYDRTEAVDPATGQVVPLHNPRLARWDTDFVWSADYSLMLGITPTGLAWSTCAVCSMNSANIRIASPQTTNLAF
jgi:5-methylcytosine-specific restriction endonuclease McrA